MCARLSLFVCYWSRLHHPQVAARTPGDHPQSNMLAILSSCEQNPAFDLDRAAPLSTPLGEALRPLLEPLGQLLYDLLRPRFVQLADMDLLAELIDILQHEVGDQHDPSRRCSLS